MTHRNNLSISHAVVVVVWTLLGLGCGDSPTRPDSRIPPPVGTPTSMMLLPCAYDDQLARCSLEARWGDLYASYRTVTDEAVWSSRAPNVVRVVSTGVLQAVAPGDADIDLSFNGFALTARFRVFAQGPPWAVFIGGEHHIQVLDEKGERLEGVLVEIIAGGNAGRQTMSDRFGQAIFLGEFVCGPITARGTRSGYRQWVGSAVACGRAGNGNWGSENIGPVIMTRE